MIGRTISHYRITRKLGAGGMGIVYEAVDTRLDRTVAMKFLPPESVRNPDAKTRFIHEAKAVSSFDHPNICNLHEIDETDTGEIFLVMACYKGETLKERIARGPLPLEEAVDIARQVAEGLAKAHEQAIVHRDIKPANIFLTSDGLPKILDFGLAKLTRGTKVTKTGTTLGTAGYMSPEQAKGDPSDRRTDLWCLGAVLYEMVTGRLPFPGKHEQAIIYGILNLEPDPVTGLRTGVPLELERIIGKCLAKDPAERYQHAEDLQADLLHLSRETSRDSAISTIGKLPQPQPRRWPWMVGAPLLAAAVSLAIWMALPTGDLPHDPSAMSLAVTEFRDLAVGDQMASVTLLELLNTALVETCPVRVQSPEYLRDVRRRSFGSADVLIQEGQELDLARTSGATFLLAGRMGAVDQEKFVTWRLVDVASGASMGAGRVNADRMTTMVDKIVREVIPLLARSSGKEAHVPQVAVASITTESSPAYRHFVSGKMLISQGRLSEARTEFELAVGQDSTFAAAYMELARCQFNLALSIPDISRARTLAGRAWELQDRLGIREKLLLQAFQDGLDYRVNREMDTLRAIIERWPDDREALQVLQQKLFWWWRFEESVELGERAFGIYPDDSSFLGSTFHASLLNLGKYREMYSSAVRYLQYNPDDPVAWDQLAEAQVCLARPDSARQSIRKALAIDEDYVRMTVALCEFAEGDLDESIRIFEQALMLGETDESERYYLIFSPYYAFSLTEAYLLAGRQAEALQSMNDAKGYVGDDLSIWQWQAGRILTRIGRADEALAMAREMERSNEIRSRIFAMRFKGHAQVALGDLAGARATALRIRELAEEMGPFMTYYALKVEADIALAEGDANGALQSVEGFRSISVNFGDLGMLEGYMMLADAQRLGGNPEAAIATHLALLRIFAGYAPCNFELGRLYEESGRPADAIAQYEKFLAMWHRADAGLPERVEAETRLAALKSLQ